MLGPGRAGRGDLEAEVLAIEAGHKAPGLGGPQLVQDVVGDLGGGRRGERDGGHALEGLPHRAQPQVIGAEVVAPLADAVGLVDRQQRHVGLAHGAHEAVGEALGRHVDQLVCAVDHRGCAVPAFVPRQARVDERGANALGVEGIHLVLHQRDERRHHQGRPLERQCGQLVAERLSMARGHDHKRVVSVHDVVDDRPLPRPKFRESKVPVKYLFEIHGGLVARCGRVRCPSFGQRVSVSRSVPRGIGAGPTPPTSR